jgi:hypothetical protein
VVEVVSDLGDRFREYLWIGLTDPARDLCRVVVHHSSKQDDDLRALLRLPTPPHGLLPTTPVAEQAGPGQVRAGLGLHLRALALVCAASLVACLITAAVWLALLGLADLLGAV